MGERRSAGRSFCHLHLGRAQPHRGEDRETLPAFGVSRSYARLGMDILADTRSDFCRVRAWNNLSLLYRRLATVPRLLVGRAAILRTDRGDNRYGQSLRFPVALDICKPSEIVGELDMIENNQCEQCDRLQRMLNNAHDAITALSANVKNLNCELALREQAIRDNLQAHREYVEMLNAKHEKEKAEWIV